MYKYEYLRPESIKEACELLQSYGGNAKIIAGGTDLMVQIRDEYKKLIDIKYVVDLTHVKELSFIKEEGEWISFGALVTHNEIYKSSIIRREAPFLSEACNTVGSPQIRNRGTIAGSICNASPASDPVPPLIALDAEVKIESAGASRIVPLKSIYVKPDVTNLSADEMVTEIRFKKLGTDGKMAFVKLGRRKALAISRINVAVALRCDEEGRIIEARIAPGCIFSVPDRVMAAEEVLIGKVPTAALIREASEKVSEAMIQRTGIRWSTEFKKPVIEALTQRAIRQAMGVE
jgi:CO/xanthine dehydrogenase FAD-binding subunit